MRKMKKINGFLIVRFNDREKRSYPQIGSFGVIDAELYSGSIDADLGVMEYDDAETIETAIEQARGLEAEEDYSENSPTYTVGVEDSKGYRETEVYPLFLAKSRETQLNTQIKSKHYPNMDPRSAAHELRGYKAALHDLGLIGPDEQEVDSDHFAPGMAEQPLPENSENLLAHICDCVCKHPDTAESQGKLDSICAECVVGRLMDEAKDRISDITAKAKERLDGLIRGIAETQLHSKAECLEHEARAYLEALGTTRTLTRVEAAIYDSAITQAVLGRPEPPARETFMSLDQHIRDNPRTRKVYALGLVLEKKCPENDCQVYLNIFNRARELDAALGEVEANGAPAMAMRPRLLSKVEELRRMYESNFAIQKFREEMKA